VYTIAIQVHLPIKRTIMCDLFDHCVILRLCPVYVTEGTSMSIVTDRYNSEYSNTIGLS